MVGRKTEDLPGTPRHSVEHDIIAKDTEQLGHLEQIEKQNQVGGVHDLGDVHANEGVDTGRSKSGREEADESFDEERLTQKVEHCECEKAEGGGVG